jgi:hypothetical protein
MNVLPMSFLGELVDRSSITHRQLESLSAYLRVASGEIKLREAAALVSQGRTRGKPGRPLTIGSYYRTVDQARTNVKKSLVTLVISLRLGLIRVEDMRRLFELVGGGTRELSSEEAERFLSLLNVLLERMVA